eukprot:3347841-Lingulodinium_polyedra.AAC.1
MACARALACVRASVSEGARGVVVACVRASRGPRIKPCPTFKRPALRWPPPRRTALPPVL